MNNCCEIGSNDVGADRELYVFNSETNTTSSDLDFEIETLPLVLPNYISIEENLFLPASNNITEQSQCCREPSLWELSTEYDDGDTFDAVSPETDVGESDLDPSTFDFKSIKYSRNINSIVPNTSQLQSQRLEVNSNYDSDVSESKASNSCNMNNFSQQKMSSCIGGKNHWGDSNSKNAKAARDNRLKKKQYVTGLEESVKLLQNENKQLSEENKKNKKEMNVLKKEVNYLRSVIANQTTLAAILKNVAKTPGITLSSSIDPFAFKATNRPATTLVSETIIQESRENNLPKLMGNNECVHQSTRHLRSSKLCPSVNPQTVFKRKCNKAIKVACSKRKKGDNDQYEKETINVEDTDSEASSEPEFSSEMNNNAGICLHVSGSSVSLELCSHCNSKIHSEIMTDHSYVKS